MIYSNQTANPHTLHSSLSEGSSTPKFSGPQYIQLCVARSKLKCVSVCARLRVWGRARVCVYVCVVEYGSRIENL